MFFKEIDRSTSKLASQICVDLDTLPLYCYIADIDGFEIERVNINLSESKSKVIEFSTVDKELVLINKKMACFLSSNGKEAIIVYLSPEIDVCGDFKVKSHNLKKGLEHSYKNGIFQITIIDSTDEIKFAQIIDLYYVKSNDSIDIDKLIKCYFN